MDKRAKQFITSVNGQGQRFATIDAGQTVSETGAKTGILDAENRRLRVSFSSEFPVDRMAFIEVLGHRDGEANLDMLNSGNASVLDTHNGKALATQIGVVESASIVDGRGLANIRLSKRSSLDDIWSDIADGIITNVSVNYRINDAEIVSERSEDTPPTVRVTKWTPDEISLVPVPADSSVGVGRSKTTETQTQTEVNVMSNDSTAPTEQRSEDSANTETRNQPETPTVDITAERKQAQQDERQRIVDITELCRKHDVADLADDLVKNDKTIEHARAAILDHLAAKSDETTTDGHSRIDVGKTGDERRRNAMASSLLVRMGYRGDDVDRKAAEDFRGYTLLDMGRRSLESSGVRAHNTDRMTLAGMVLKRAGHTTSDFPLIFEEALHKMLMGAFTAVPDKWRRFCATGSVSDFRNHNRYSTGAFSNLKKVNEGGEYEQGNIPDAEKQVAKADTYGRILKITREMIVNDDMGALGNVSAALGRAAARTIEANVFAALAANSGRGPTLSDGKALFHADHNNLVDTGSGAVPSMATIDAGRQLMGAQTDPSGLELLDVVPDRWLGPLSLGGSVRQINESTADLTANSNSGVANFVRGIFTDVIDTGRLTGNAWYMFANPADEPVLEVSFLDGQETPMLDSQEDFNTDGLAWKVRLDHGVSGIGFRGAFLNAGAQRHL